MDELHELRTEIAYRRWQLTGCDDKELNWREASKVITHFLRRRPESIWWKQDEEDYRSLYGDLFDGQFTDNPAPRPEEDSGNN